MNLNDILHYIKHVNKNTFVLLAGGPNIKIYILINNTFRRKLISIQHNQTRHGTSRKQNAIFSRGVFYYKMTKVKPKSTIFA